MIFRFKNKEKQAVVSGDVTNSELQSTKNELQTDIENAKNSVQTNVDNSVGQINSRLNKTNSASVAGFGDKGAAFHYLRYGNMVICNFTGLSGIELGAGNFMIGGGNGEIIIPNGFRPKASVRVPFLASLGAANAHGFIDFRPDGKGYMQLDSGVAVGADFRALGVWYSD